MLISMNWIEDFVDLSGLDKISLIKRFTLSTAEVEEISVKGDAVRGVVAARIESVEAHPNSQKLHLLKVNTGTEVVDCVCGAPNVREGMVVPFATLGGHAGGMDIARAQIAGYESCGMCCSERELGISDDHSGLMELPGDTSLGTDLHELCELDDIVFEVDNKTQTPYATPMGEMLVEMTTSRIGFEEEDDHLKVEVEYSLDINYDHVSDCRIVLDVTSKGCAKLELGEA